MSVVVAPIVIPKAPDVLFEIPAVVASDIKFSPTTLDLPPKMSLLSLFHEYRKIRTEIHKHIGIDNELKYIFNLTSGNSIGRIHLGKTYDFLLYLLFFKDAPVHLKKGIVLYNKAEEAANRKIGLLPIYKDSPATKFDFIYSIYLNDYSKRNDVTGNYLSDLNILQNYLQKHLKVGGSAIFLPNYYTHEGLSFPFLLKLFFKHVVVHYSEQLIAIGYNGLAYNSTAFAYLDIAKINDYVSFAKKMLEYRIKVNRSFLAEDKAELFKHYQLNIIASKRLLGIPLTPIDNNYFLYSLNEFHKNPMDYKKYIKAGIGAEEGQFLLNTIIENKCKKVVEVGFANGISAAYMLTALKETGGHLISIDPFQTEQWKDAASILVKKMKMKSRHTLIQKKSHVALPDILKKHGEGSFDLVFVDGWHTFDYTLLDVFYAEKLIRLNGIIVIDDAMHPGVAACVKYLNTNWKFLQPMSGPKTFAMYRKIKTDERDWDYHAVWGTSA